MTGDRMSRVPPTPITPFRIPVELKQAAAAKAKAEGRTLTAVVVELLTAWVKQPPRKPAKD